MYDSRLITILRHIDKKEYRKINDLVKSPYFNKNQEVVQLYEYLRKLAPEFKPEKLIKEDVFQKAFPNKKITSARQNKLMFTLRELLEIHLTIDYVDKRPHFMTKYLSEQYISMNMDDYALKILNDAVDFLSKQPESTEIFTLINMHQFDAINLKSFVYKEENIQNIQEGIKDIDKTYILRKMHYEVILTMLSEKYNLNIEQHGMDAVLEMYRNAQYNSPLLDTFVAIVNAFKSPCTLSAYYELKQTVLNHIDGFHSVEQNYCFRWLSTYFTYTTRATESNEREINIEYVNLYKTGFQKGYLLHNKISAAIFLNSFIVAGVLGDTEWCEYMMNRYIDQVYANDRPVVDFFTKVYLNFVQENDETVVKLMQNKNMPYQKNSLQQLLKFYLLLSLFRLKRFDELFDTINNTRVFLYRQKEMNTDYRNKHLEGLKEYEYFFKIHQDKKKLKELLEKIKTSQMPKHWLQKEIEKNLAEK